MSQWERVELEPFSSYLQPNSCLHAFWHCTLSCCCSKRGRQWERWNKCSSWPRMWQPVSEDGYHWNTSWYSWIWDGWCNSICPQEPRVQAHRRTIEIQVFFCLTYLFSSGTGLLSCCVPPSCISRCWYRPWQVFRKQNCKRNSGTTKRRKKWDKLVGRAHV